MATAAPAANVRNVKSEMQAHRERLKRAQHPGRTQKEAGFSPAETRWLTIGVCRDLTGEVERGEKLANWALVILAGLLFLAMGFGIVTDRWAEQEQVQTVQSVETLR